MKTIFYASAAAFILLLNGSAFAADLSKAEQSAGFRLKVASCKAQAKTDAVKATSSAFYSYMAGCIDRVTVQVAWAPVKEEAK